MRLNWNNIGKGLTDVGNAIKTRRISNEVGELGQEGTTVEGTGLKITGPDGQTSTAVLDPASNPDFETIMRQYQDAGYGVERMEAPQYAARSGSRDLGVHDNAAAAGLQARGFEYDRMGKEAAIYDKYGEFDMARGLRKDMRRERLTDMTERRADKQMTLAESADKRATDAAGRQAEQHEYDVSRRGVKAGIEDNQAEIARMQTAVAKNNFEFDEAAKGGLEGLVKWYDARPDGVRVELARGKDGNIIARRFNEDTGEEMKPWALGKTDAAAVDKVTGMWKNGGNLEMLKLEAERAKIRASDASAAKDYAGAGYYKTGGAGVNSPASQYIALAQRAAKGDKQAERALELLGKRDMGSPVQMTPDKVFAMRSQIEDTLASKVPGWKNMPPARREEFVDREMAKYTGGPGQGGPAADPYAALLQGGPANPAPAAPGLKVKPAGRQFGLDDASGTPMSDASRRSRQELIKLDEQFAMKSQLLGEAMQTGDKATAAKLQGEIELLNRQMGALKQQAGIE